MKIVIVIIRTRELRVCIGRPTTFTLLTRAQLRCFSHDLYCCACLNKVHFYFLNVFTFAVSTVASLIFNFKHVTIALQAGTQFWDATLEEELRQGLLTNASLDR